MRNQKDFLFDRPVPGQSLTAIPGSMPYEQPPQYVTEDEAMYYVMDQLSSKTVAPAIKHALKKGVYASDITNAILLKSFSQGKITPDMAGLIAKRTLGAVVATGMAQGVSIKDMRIKKPSRKELELAQMLAEDDPASGELTSGPGGSVVTPYDAPPMSPDEDPASNELSSGAGGSVVTKVPTRAMSPSEDPASSEGMNPSMETWRGRATPDEQNKINSSSDPRVQQWQGRETPDQRNRRNIRGIMGNE